MHVTQWPAAKMRFVSFDGSTECETLCFAPDRYRFWTGPGEHHVNPPVSRGAGLSYVAATFSASSSSVDHRHFNRLLDFDSDEGVLEVEAGATLGQVYEFAAPRGFMLSVQPGHPAITIGGCIGADVHGKNQWRDGTFVHQVDELTLFHPRHGVFTASRLVHPEIFDLTCGGYGLTGNIIKAKLRLSRIPGTDVILQTRPVPSLPDLCDVLPQAAARHALLYSWHNLASSRRFGNGFVVTGDFIGHSPGVAPSPGKSPRAELSAEHRSAYPLPLFNAVTVPPFNWLYHASVRLKRGPSRISLYDFLFPVHNKVMYFYLFGKRGFHEYQAVIPHDRFPEFAGQLSGHLRRNPIPVTLASAKLFGKERKFLRFSGSGICLALNYPRTAAALQFSAWLDGLMRSCGGWPNIIKDSRLTAETVETCYPDYHLFRNALRSYDPKRLYKSELSERLSL